MAIVKCPECGREVSDKAQSCIGCGFPLSAGREKSSYFGDSPFSLFSIKDEMVNLECARCGKVFSFKRELFSSVSEDECVPKVDLSCPNCMGGISGRNAPIKRKDSQARSLSHDGQKEAEGKTENNGCGCSSIGIAAVVILLCLSLLGTCSGGNSYSGSSDNSDSSSYSSMSDDEKNRRAAEEEASHYYYDEFGHIRDDRD